MRDFGGRYQNCDWHRPMHKHEKKNDYKSSGLIMYPNYTVRHCITIEKCTQVVARTDKNRQIFT